MVVLLGRFLIYSMDSLQALGISITLPKIKKMANNTDFASKCHQPNTSGHTTSIKQSPAFKGHYFVFENVYSCGKLNCF